MERAGTIPVLDVYVDSPMAVDATHVYGRHRADLNVDWADEMHVLKTERTRFVRSVADSKALAALTGGATHHQRERHGHGRTRAASPLATCNGRT